MSSYEFNPEAHEEFVSQRLLAVRKQAARLAIFDEMIDYHHDGDCTFEQAIEQFRHDIAREGCDYPVPPEQGSLF